MRGRSARRPRSSPTASTRPTCSRGGSASGRRDVRSSSCRSGSTSRRSGRPARPRRRRRLGGRRSAPRLRAAPDGRRGRCPRRASSSSRRPTARARSPAGRATSRSRPTCRSTRCAVGSSAPASSRSPCARTATRARRPCSSRRWRSPSRSSSRGRPRSRRATGSRTGTTCGSSRRETPPPSARALAEVLGDDVHARALGVAGARDRRVGAHLGSLRRADPGRLLATQPRARPDAGALSRREARADDAGAATSSSAPHGAHGCVSTKSSSTPSQADAGVPSTVGHSSPSMFILTTSVAPAALSGDRFREHRPRSASTRTCSMPTSCCGERLRRMERVAPRGAHHVELASPAIGADRDRCRAPLAASSPDRCRRSPRSAKFAAPARTRRPRGRRGRARTRRSSPCARRRRPPRRPR